MEERVPISGGEGADLWRRVYRFLEESVPICGGEGADFWRRGCRFLEERVPISGGMSLRDSVSILTLKSLLYFSVSCSITMACCCSCRLGYAG